MSRVEHAEVHYTCNGCGAHATAPGTLDEHDTPEGWGVLHVQYPGEPVADAEADVCPSCWARGFRFHGADFQDREQ